MSEVHDVYCGLVPPIKHDHHQYVPHLVAGAQVVQLTWEITLRDLGDIEQEGRASYQVHHYHTRQEQLYDIRGESSIKPNPVARRNHTDASHTEEDSHSYLSPVVAEVTRMNLSAEDCQDQRQHRQQVHLSPKTITVESIEEAGDVTAQNANRDARIVQ